MTRGRRVTPSATIEPMEQEHVALVATWLTRPDVTQWLDFGRGRQSLPAAALAIMLRQDAHRLWLVREPGGEPVGIVALGEINPVFDTAVLWYAVGAVEARGRGVATAAVTAALDEAFGPLALHAVQAWVVAGNEASVHVLRRNGFRSVGRQRACHVIDGERRDRVLFDRLADDGDRHRT